MHNVTTRTLEGLLALIRKHDEAFLPATMTAVDHTAHKAKQLGALLAGVWAACEREGIGARAAVTIAHLNALRDADVRVILDRFRSVGPSQVPFDATLNLNDVRRGAALAETAIASLPDPSKTDPDTYATWVGAAAGALSGILEAGLNDTAYTAFEISRQAILQYAEPSFGAPVSVNN